MTVVEERTAAPPRAAARGGWFGQLLLRVHFYAGILVGPFILVAAVSGGLYALAPQLDQIVYAHALHAPVTSERLTLGEQIVAAQEHVGSGAAPVAVRPAPEPGDTTRVMFADDDLGASQTRGVFVDPGTGEIRGDMTVYGSSGSLPVRTWISNLHRNLHLGEAGRLYSELAASWLGIVVLAGLVLWIVRIRKARVKRDLVRPNRKHRGYRGLFGWHASVGVWVVLGALVLSATGITWSTYAGANVSALRAAIGGGTPVVDTSLDGATAPSDAHADHHGAATAPTGAANPATFDAVLAIAERTVVNTGEVEIRPPAEPGLAWTVKELKAAWPVEADTLAIDGTTLQIVDTLRFADYPLLAKLATWGISLHMGVLFGLVNQLALLLVAAGIATLVVLGYTMWWKRRPTRGGAVVSVPPRAGALRAAPWWGIAAVVAGAAVVGWWLPLVGWTLAGFVVLDVILSVRRRATMQR